MKTTEKKKKPPAKPTSKAATKSATPSEDKSVAPRAIPVTATPDISAPQQQADPSTKIQSTPEFLILYNELNIHQDQQNKRQQLIREIETLLTHKYGATNRLITYLFRFGHSRASINSADIAYFEACLNSIPGAEQINVLLHSPGGDGTIIEKMVEMCRAHLVGNNRKLRVIVPNIAKSAATLFALGSDEILMGYCSELGPIDPQVQIAVSGVMHGISALSFVESRDTLMKDLAKAIQENKPTMGLMQQLASLNIPFTSEMENWIGFAQKTGATLLDKYMLMPKIPNASHRRRKANEIAKKLLSKQLFPVHGQFIDGATAKRELELEVDVLDKADELWKLIWSYYLRCELQMNLQLQPPMIKIKLFETTGLSLVTQDTVN
ncbi:MAG: SDH family Clp fold serine proteinase [Acidobacteriaceae bacterium]